MNDRNVALAAVFALVLPASLTVAGCFSSEPVLTVHLRCEGPLSGTLSAATRSGDGEAGSEKVFDLEAACKLGTVEVDGYQSEGSVRFAFRRDNGETAGVVAEYGRDIQRDQDGFYMVLKITQGPPFIANDRI